MAALGVAIAGFLRTPTKKEEIKVVEVPTRGTEFEGPIYTGTGTGYIIDFENGVRFYFAGDTDVFWDMKYMIGDYYKPDVAFLPIGDVYTMGPKTAAYATTLINPRYVIPYHYHTFPEMIQTPDGFMEEVTHYREKGATRAEPVVLEYGVERDIEGIKTTWLGHASILFESVGRTRIVVDPWLEANPDCPAKYKDLTAFDDIDIILLTHGHVDHLTADEVDRLSKMYNSIIIAQFELGIYLQDKVAAPIALMNKGGSLTKEKIIAQGMVPAEAVNMTDITITMVAAEHSSSPP